MITNLNIFLLISRNTLKRGVRSACNKTECMTMKDGYLQIEIEREEFQKRNETSLNANKLQIIIFYIIF